MIPNIDSKPTMKPFKDVSGIFVTVATQHIYHITDSFLPCNVEALNEDKIYPIKTI